MANGFEGTPNGDAVAGQDRAADERAREASEVRLRSDYCVFSRGGASFAISTRVAREVLDWRPFTPLPRAPEGLVGAFNLRGEVIPVARLDRFLGVAEKPIERSDALLVLADGELTLAAFVDGVTAVRHIAPWEIQRLEPVERQRQPLLRGTIGRDEQQTSVLDGERLLAAVAAHVASGFRPAPGVLSKGARERGGAIASGSPPEAGSGGG